VLRFLEDLLLLGTKRLDAVKGTVEVVPVLKPREVAAILARLGFAEVVSVGRIGSIVTETAEARRCRFIPVATSRRRSSGRSARHWHECPRLHRRSLRESGQRSRVQRRRASAVRCDAWFGSGHPF
jgi:hypothetical protein